ncbi:ABC transporter ATP-binding protein [Nakamurella aerolata]|uniref:ABC transporter ATP-binding protein n=1 Tax=Nakamurella aerolata TaxID=1656892 RepID=A0A849A7M7_9ACTN|nr:ABC transporter ATP-binding protein [Nakamurella aerolata]NNG35108.1 ABC transporter ATP-binding protein [Nakamurella aerolata]
MTDVVAAPPGAAAATGSEPLLRVQGVHVVHRIRSRKLIGHGNVYALTDANLSIAAGETVGIVGESGCGKSTLAKVIVGLQRPTEGAVNFRGTSLWEMSQKQRARQFGREVGMIFQDPSTALNRRLSIAKIIADPMDVHGVGSSRQRRERVQELMALVGLPTSVADAVPGQLSGGQRQRVAIARALALDPALLVADEPTSALDVSVRAQILNLLMDLKDRLGLAMVFVSHDIQTVQAMSDRIVTMYLGRIAEQAPANDIPDRAYHPYSRALFSATPSLLRPTEPIVLSGAVPSATNPPSGCNFRTRCWKATDECANALPPLTRVGAAAQADETAEPLPLHEYRCWHPELPDAPSDAAEPLKTDSTDTHSANTHSADTHASDAQSPSAESLNAESLNAESPKAGSLKKEQA